MGRAFITSFLLLLIAQYSLAQIPQTMSYQGLLTSAAGKPVDGNYNLTFRLYDVAAGGGSLWTEMHSAVPVVNGIFNVILGSAGSPLKLPFDRQYWLGIQVGAGPELSPRIKLTSTPYSLNSMNAQTVSNGSVTTSKLADNAVTPDKIQPDVLSSVDGVSNDGGNIDLIPGTNIAITPNDGANTINISVSGVWKLIGNSGTTPGTNFLGTTDDNALEFKVNNTRALRLEPNATSPNIIGGYYGNSITSGVYGATISGGGANSYLNLVTDNYGTIGGGRYNQAGDNAGATDDNNYATVGGGFYNRASGSSSTVGGGYENRATGTHSTVGGGIGNQAKADYSTVGGGGYNKIEGSYSTLGGGSGNKVSGYSSTLGGGYNNEVAADYSTVGGGIDNRATGGYSTVGGGISNLAAGGYSTVPGGRDNVAQGLHSFAAGRRAKAAYRGSFVWGDSTDADVSSTGDDQFKVRASGGVYLYTNAGLTTGMYLAAGGSGWNVVSDRDMKDNIREVDGKDILNKLKSIPISQWNYKTQDSSIQHIGPMAQDFHEAFRMGEDDKSINSIDSDGVALAAIQGLYEIVKEKEAENRELKQEIDDLKARLAALEKLVTGAKGE